MLLNKNSKELALFANISAILFGGIIALFGNLFIPEANILFNLAFPILIAGCGLLSILFNLLQRGTKANVFGVFNLLPIFVMFIVATVMLLVTVQKDLTYLVFYDGFFLSKVFPFWLIFAIFFAFFAIAYMILNINETFAHFNLVKSRNIRRTLATVIGILFVIVAVAWTYLSDTLMSSEVKWLLATLVGIISGALAITSSYMLGNAESKAWLPLDLLALVASLGFVFAYGPIVIGNGEAVAAIQNALANTGLQPLALGFYILGIVFVILNSFCLMSDIVLYYRLDKDKML